MIWDEELAGAIVEAEALAAAVEIAYDDLDKDDKDIENDDDLMEDEKEIAVDLPEEWLLGLMMIFHPLSPIRVPF